MNYALITGASSGIGKALATQLAARGYHLALISRSTDELESLKSQLRETYPVGVKILSVDLLSDQAIDTVLSWINKEAISVNILVNNAALAKWGRIEDIGFDEQIEMIKLNQLTVFSLCYKLIPLLKTSHNPHILNVVGIGAFQPVPYFAIYAASKSFVLSFSRALRYELAGTGINVSCLCNGPADTDFFTKAGFIKPGIANNKTLKLSAEEIAKSGIEGLMSRKELITPGLSNKMGMFLSKLLPNSWMVRIAGYLFG